MKIKSQWVLIALALSFTGCPGWAKANGDDIGRPRIGLVLGGGGARGAAHVGVLRELERLNVPVDAIAGTSMGAIIGGLYASGMTPEELEEVVVTLDWAGTLKDGSSRQDLRFRRKQDDAAFPIKIELGLRDGDIRIPKGVVQGQRLGLVLRELTLAVANVRDFDDLPIPFRAVAADIVTGEAVTMNSGDLALAIRASMSAPGIFAPVKIGDRLLVDGGLVGNVPVEVIRQMDVDVVIAVDVEFPLYKPEELTSAVAISEQMLTILIRKETVRQLEMLSGNDILIRPELGEFGSSNFAEIASAIEPGANATLTFASELSSLSLSDEAFAKHIANRSGAPLAEKIDFVRVRDDGNLSERVLKSRLETERGDKIDATKLAGDAERLYGLQLYEQVDYHIVAEGDETGVEFVARSKDWGPNFLQFGLSLQDDLEGNTSFNLTSRMTRVGINSLGAEWRTDLQLGTDPILFSEFYQPLSFDSRYFVAPRALARQSTFNVFLAEENLARYRVTDAELGLDVGRELGLWGEIRVGVFYGRGQARLKVGDPVFPTIDFDDGGVFARFNVDTLDDAQIPLNGSRVNVQWASHRDGLGADDSFDTLETSVSSVWTSGRHSLNAALQFNTSRNASTVARSFFSLGGFLNLSGFARGEISGPHAAVARLVYYRRAGETKGLYEVPLYFGASVEAGNIWQSRSDISLRSALINGSLFVGRDTPIGPVFLAAGYGEGGNRSLYLSLGARIQ